MRSTTADWSGQGTIEEQAVPWMGVMTCGWGATLLLGATCQSSLLYDGGASPVRLQSVLFVTVMVGLLSVMATVRTINRFAEAGHHRKYAVVMATVMVGCIAAILHGLLIYV